MAYGHTATFIEVGVPTHRPLCGRTATVRLTGREGDICIGQIV